MRRFKGLSLFWRIYIYGLLLLFFAFAAAMVFSHNIQGVGQAPPMQMLTKPWREHMAHLLTQADGAARLQSLGREFHAVTGNSFTFVQPSGQLIASAGPHPFRPNGLVLDKRGMVRADGMAWMVIPLNSMGQHQGTLAVGWADSSKLLESLPFLSGIFLLLLLMPLVQARALTRPIGRLTRASKQLAQGDLTARSGLIRGDELGDLASAFDTMAAKLDHRIRAEKALFANLSHEIRTPLARLRVALEILRESAQTGIDPADHWEGLGEDLNELEGLVDDLLTVARLELSLAEDRPDGILLKPEAIDLDDWLRQRTARFEKIRQGRRFELDLRAACTVPLDPTWCGRLLDNLLENACKYAPAQPPPLLASRRLGDAVEISLLDYGPGISEDRLEAVFEPFFRTETARSGDGGGVGLGLTLCRAATRAHGGRIHAEIAPGGGCRFVVTLPLEAA